MQIQPVWGLATGSGDPYPGGVLYQALGPTSFREVLGTDLTFSTSVSPRLVETTLQVSRLSATRHRPSALLTESASGAAVAGARVEFSLGVPGRPPRRTCAATTSAQGVARCSVSWTARRGEILTAVFAGDAVYAPASGSAN